MDAVVEYVVFSCIVFEEIRSHGTFLITCVELGPLLPRCALLREKSFTERASRCQVLCSELCAEWHQSLSVVGNYSNYIRKTYTSIHISPLCIANCSRYFPQYLTMCCCSWRRCYGTSFACLQPVLFHSPQRRELGHFSPWIKAKVDALCCRPFHLFYVICRLVFRDEDLK